MKRGEKALVCALLSGCSTSAQAPDATADALSTDADDGVDPDAGTTTRLTRGGASWFDPEVLPTTGGGLIAWQDGDNDIRAAALDEATGLLIPGSERLLGDRAAPLLQTYNGPEFGRDSSGWAVYYTRVESGGVFQAARATLVDEDAVLEVVTSGSHHFSPLASKDATASSTRLIALRRPPAWGVALWIDSAAPTIEHDIVEVVDRPDFDARWIDGTYSFVTNNHPNFPGELSVVDTVAGSVTRISGGEGTIGNPYGWQAPEASGELFALATIDDTQIGIWARSADAWYLVTTLSSPELGFGFVGSPEPFVANGRSYASLVAATTAEPIPGTTDQHVWIISLDPAYPFARRCDDGAPGPTTRVDPEVLLGRDQAFVYYYTMTGPSAVAYVCATGVATR